MQIDNRVYRRAAEAIDRRSADFLWQPGEPTRDTGDVVALRCFGIGAPHQDVLEKGRIETSAFNQGAKRDRREVIGTDILQASLASESKGGACEARDHCFRRCRSFLARGLAAVAS